MASTTQLLSEAVNVQSLSVISLFYHADWVVKSVMIGLLGLSVVCWGIIFEKLRLLKRINERANVFDEYFWSDMGINTLKEKIGQTPKDPLSAVFIAGMNEFSFSKDDHYEKRTSRVTRVMQVTINRQATFLEKNLILLASTASAAPFIGLFGTVWGIMNSFTAIAGVKQTSLAVVAPGIAEALFATAIGLVAAIPATIFYNKISSDLDKYLVRLDIFQEEFLTVIEREA